MAKNVSIKVANVRYIIGSGPGCVEVRGSIRHDNSFWEYDIITGTGANAMSQTYSFPGVGHDEFGSFLTEMLSGFEEEGFVVRQRYDLIWALVKRTNRKAKTETMRAVIEATRAHL